jgi:hypothetical protein
MKTYDICHKSLDKELEKAIKRQLKMAKGHEIAQVDGADDDDDDEDVLFSRLIFE